MLSVSVGFMEIIGIILLIGIVKKNGIMLVDFALEAERTRGLSPEESIHEACRMRFRPILMTTMCALLGGVPVLGNDTRSELRQPLGYAMVGGLVVSQVLTLFTARDLHLHGAPGAVGRSASRAIRIARDRCGGVKLCFVSGNAQAHSLRHRAGLPGHPVGPFKANLDMARLMTPAWNRHI